MRVEFQRIARPASARSLGAGWNTQMRVDERSGESTAQRRHRNVPWQQWPSGRKSTTRHARVRWQHLHAVIREREQRLLRRAVIATLIAPLLAALEHGAARRAKFVEVLLHTGGYLLPVRNLGCAKMNRVAATGVRLFVLAGGVRRAGGTENERNNQTDSKQAKNSIHVRSGIAEVDKISSAENGPEHRD
jgi:hypothetical protein